jgi:hypothetical protein
MTVETVSIYQRICTASIIIKAGTECPAWGTETRQIEENIALNELERAIANIGKQVCTSVLEVLPALRYLRYLKNLRKT